MQGMRGAQAGRMWAVMRRSVHSDTRPAEFNQRRAAYRAHIKELRRQFMKERAEAAEAAQTARKAAATDGAGDRATRAARKHARSMVRFEGHKERIAAAKARRIERKQMLFRGWEEREDREESQRAGLLGALNEASAGWVRDETLNAHVEQAVDELLVESGRRTAMAGGTARGE